MTTTDITLVTKLLNISKYIGKYKGKFVGPKQL